MSEQMGSCLPPPIQADDPTPSAHNPESSGDDRTIEFTADDAMKNAALAALDAGFSIIAIRRKDEIINDPEKGNVIAGAKHPCGKWKQFQQKPPSRSHINRWFKDDHGRGFALILGLVSGNAECLEFDDLETEEAFLAAAEPAGLTPILDRIRNGYCQRSPRGTLHFIYRCEVIGGSMKLAQKPTGEVDDQKRPKLKTLAETKGEASFVIAAPSPGTVHASGKPYAHVGGSLATVATITVDERTQLLALAATFDETPEPQQRTKPPSKPKVNSTPTDGKVRPGDDYNQKATIETWHELLTSLEWTRTSVGHGREFWKHPNTDKDVSAVVGGQKNVMVVYSSSTIFEQWSHSNPVSYSPFAAYALIRHGRGPDAFTKAAKALAHQGYGSPQTRAHAKFESRANKPSGIASDPQGIPTMESEFGENESAPQDAEDELEIHLTDTGNALRFASEHVDYLRHVGAWGWVFFDGRRWIRDEAERAQEFAKRTVARMYREASERYRLVAEQIKELMPDEDDPIAGGMDEADEEEVKKLRAALKTAKRFLDWAFVSEHVARIKAMLTLAKSDARLVLSVEQFDVDPFTFNCSNGTINLRDGELRPHNRSDFLTRLSPVAFDRDAACEKWIQYTLATFARDLDLIRWLRRLLGYTLTADVREQIVAILHGNGGNGKSVFIETIMDIMGDYALKANAELLLAGKHDRHETEKAQLAGKRFVAAVETGEGRKLNETLVKEVVGGDRITARFMRMDHFTFDPTYKLALATNHKPEIRGIDDGIWRRIRLVPFNQRFWKDGDVVGPPELKADPALREKLKNEYPGILAWMVTGCLQWQKEGLGTCKAVEVATSDYRQAEDRVREFVDDCCEFERQAETQATVIFKAYVKWSEDRGERPVSQTMFGTRLTNMGIDRRKSNGRTVLAGIRPKNLWDGDREARES